MKNSTDGLRKILKQKNEGLYSRFSTLCTRLEESYLRHATLPYFTSHGSDHSISIEAIVDRLLPAQKKDAMNDMEIFILLCSIYSHDVGMAVRLETDEERKDESKQETEQRLRLIRDTHSKRAYSFILDKAMTLGLDKGPASAIAEICLAHSDLKYSDGPRVYTFEEIMKKSPLKTIEKYDVRMHLLAALLRLADELDLDYYRAMADLEVIRDMPEMSRREWMKHQLVSGINIDSTKYEIFVDIFETDVYGDTVQDSSTAMKNMGLTELIIKLRRALFEVLPALQEEGLNYKDVKFRDPAILALKSVLRRREIPESASMLYVDKFYGSAGVQHLLFELEKLELSPEILIGNSIDFLFELMESFPVESLRMLGRYSVVGEKKQDDDLITLHQHLLSYLNGYDLLHPASESSLEVASQNDMSVAYKRILMALAEYLTDKGDINQFLGDAYRHVYSIAQRYIETLCPDNYFIPGVQSAIWRLITKDLFAHIRKSNYLKKSNNHYIFMVFSDELFSRLATKCVSASWDKRRAESFRQDYFKEMSRVIGEHRNIRLYYSADSLGSEMHTITSELTLLGSPHGDSLVVVSDVNRVLSYYDESMRILQSPDTWRIKDVNLATRRFTFDREDEFYIANRKYKDRFIDKAERELGRRMAEILGLD